MDAGWLRRIVYTFVGLLVGNAAFGMLYLGYTAVGCLVAGVPVSNVLYLSGMLAFYFVFSIAGWILLGVPFALAMPPRVLIRFHPVVIILIGGVLGFLSLLAVNAVLSRRTPFLEIRKAAAFFVFAAVIGGLSAYAYRVLLLRFKNRSMQAEEVIS